MHSSMVTAIRMAGEEEAMDILMGAGIMAIRTTTTTMDMGMILTQATVTHRS